MNIALLGHGTVGRGVDEIITERVEGAGKLVRATRDVLRVVGFLNNDRLGRIHLTGRLYDNLTVELDAPILNHLCGRRPRFREPASDQLRINTAKLHPSLRSL